MPPFADTHRYEVAVQVSAAGPLRFFAAPSGGGTSSGFTYTGGFTVELYGEPSEPRKCAGRPATIVQNPADPVGTPIFGTPRDDVIVGTDAEDQIFGRGGEDRICGGGGNDLILGNAGGDLLFGDAGNDRILGGDDVARDVLGGDEGEDRLIAGRGRDSLDGGPDQDILNGGPGDDEFTASTGVLPNAGGDRLLGGPGDDEVRYGLLGIELRRGVLVDLSKREGGVRGGGPNALTDDLRDIEDVRGTRFDDILVGDGETNFLRGGRGHDVLRGLGDRDNLRGEVGEDTLAGGAGADDLRGGPDRDTCLRDSRDDAPGPGDCEQVVLATR